MFVCDHAAHASGGLRLRLEITAATRSLGVAQHQHCARGYRVPQGCTGTMLCPARPAEAGFHWFSGRPRCRCGERKCASGGTCHVCGSCGWVGGAKPHTWQCTGTPLGQRSRCGNEAVAPRSFGPALRRTGRSPETTVHPAVADRGGRAITPTGNTTRTATPLPQPTH